MFSSVEKKKKKVLVFNSHSPHTVLQQIQKPVIWRMSTVDYLGFLTNGEKPTRDWLGWHPAGDDTGPNKEKCISIVKPFGFLQKA